MSTKKDDTTKPLSESIVREINIIESHIEQELKSKRMGESSSSFKNRFEANTKKAQGKAKDSDKETQE